MRWIFKAKTCSLLQFSWLLGYNTGVSGSKCSSDIDKRYIRKKYAMSILIQSIEKSATFLGSIKLRLFFPKYPCSVCNRT
jgi:hypothetical protein